ncbi:MAG: nucleotidyltransferase domain-containing protein [bacterium]
MGDICINLFHRSQKFGYKIYMKGGYEYNKKSLFLFFIIPGFMAVSWEITPQKIKAVIDRIIEVSKPRRIILFGSYIKGTTDKNSDLDVLVVMRQEVKNPRKESVRIRRLLKGILMPMDILVIHEELLEEIANSPGLIYREAIKNGKVVYELPT